MNEIINTQQNQQPNYGIGLLAGGGTLGAAGYLSYRHSGSLNNNIQNFKNDTLNKFNLENKVELLKNQGNNVEADKAKKQLEEVSNSLKNSKINESNILSKANQVKNFSRFGKIGMGLGAGLGVAGTFLSLKNNNTLQ